MMIGISLELEDGREAHIRFSLARMRALAFGAGNHWIHTPLTTSPFRENTEH